MQTVIKNHIVSSFDCIVTDQSCYQSNISGSWVIYTVYWICFGILHYQSEMARYDDLFGNRDYNHLCYVYCCYIGGDFYVDKGTRGEQHSPRVLLVCKILCRDWEGKSFISFVVYDINIYSDYDQSVINLYRFCVQGGVR